VNARFAKPLDKDRVDYAARHIKRIVTLEEGVATGGFGSAVLEFLEGENIKDASVKIIGLPDHFIEHGKRELLLKKYHLDPVDICRTIEREVFNKEYA
jgi:1-deoxy-D-xylulose-5-phosphate synthase